MFPEPLSRCRVVLWAKNESGEDSIFDATAQTATFEGESVEAYGVAIDQDPAAIETQGPAPSPADVIDKAQLRGSEEGVVTFFFEIVGENQSPTEYVLDLGGDRYRVEGHGAG
jgi:hypothetical protein